jgi:hypothetical protein
VHRIPVRLRERVLASVNLPQAKFALKNNKPTDDATGGFVTGSSAGMLQ